MQPDLVRNSPCAPSSVASAEGAERPLLHAPGTPGCGEARKPAPSAMGIQQEPPPAAPPPGAAGAGAPARFVHPFPPWRRRVMVVIFSAMTALLSADQNLLAPNLTAAADDFGLNERQKDTYLGGYVMAAFFLIGAPAAIVCGYLTDKVNRVHLLFAIVVIGQGPCLCTYFVKAFWQFLILRMLTGVAVGGVFPLVFSLLGDLFPASQRAAMASLVQIAMGLGIGAGQLLAGVIGPATNWRLPFVLVAAPALLLALLMVLTTREPPRGAFEEALRHQYAEGVAYEETISWEKARRALRSPSNWILITQAIPGCLPWGVMQTYLNDYLSQEKGFSVQVATIILVAFGVGGGVGIVAGGAAGQLLYNWKKEGMAVLSGLCVMAGVAPVYYLINVDLQAAGLPAALAMSALAGVVVSVAGPNLRAAMLNVNEPETRGVALALQSVTDDLGRGLGPIIVAGFITSLGGRRNAFNLAVAGWVPCGLIIMGLVFCMRRDEEAVQMRLAQRSEAAAEVRRRSTAGSYGDGGGGGGGGGRGAAPAAPGSPRAANGAAAGGGREAPPGEQQQQRRRHEGRGQQQQLARLSLDLSPRGGLGGGGSGGEASPRQRRRPHTADGELLPLWHSPRGGSGGAAAAPAGPAPGAARGALAPEMVSSDSRAELLPHSPGALDSSGAPR